MIPWRFLRMTFRAILLTERITSRIEKESRLPWHKRDPYNIRARKSCASNPRFLRHKSHPFRSSFLSFSVFPISVSCFLSLFFLHIIKDKIARDIAFPFLFTPLPHYRNCKTPTSANGGGFQERERLMGGIENVLQDMSSYLRDR